MGPRSAIPVLSVCVTAVLAGIVLLFGVPVALIAGGVIGVAVTAFFYEPETEHARQERKARRARSVQRGKSARR